MLSLGIRYTAGSAGRVFYLDLAVFLTLAKIM